MTQIHAIEAPDDGTSDDGSLHDLVEHSSRAMSARATLLGLEFVQAVHAGIGKLLVHIGAAAVAGLGWATMMVALCVALSETFDWRWVTAAAGGLHFLAALAVLAATRQR